MSNRCLKSKSQFSKKKYSTESEYNMYYKLKVALLDNYFNKYLASPIEGVEKEKDIITILDRNIYKAFNNYAINYLRKYELL